jgi:hypothetical protein
VDFQRLHVRFVQEFLAAGALGADVHLALHIGTDPILEGWRR